MNKLPFLVISLGSILLLSFFVLESEGKGVRGVPPENRPHYKAAMKSGTFNCISDSKAIPFAAVNDEFCDCADGSDEPGTSACPNGSFYCPNRHFKPMTVPSSRVNDGICDCCDGTDELGKKDSACENNCEDLGRFLRVEAEKKVRVHQNGARIRFEHIKRGLQARKDRKAKLKELKTELEAAKAESERLVAIRNEKEKVEQEAKLAHEQAWNAAQDAKRALEEPAKVNEGETPKENLDTPQQVERETMPDYDENTKALIEAATAARTEANAASDRVSALERDIRATEEKNTMDLGAEQEFFTLSEGCLEHTTDKYVYELCPFKSAKQKNHEGGAVSLGTYTGWTGSPNKYSQMKYENGEKCWGGPHRSLLVNLVCAESTFINNVSEPNKCEYQIVLHTPGACDPNYKSELPVEDVEHDEL